MSACQKILSNFSYLFFIVVVSVSCTCSKEKEKLKGIGVVNEVKNVVYYKNFSSLEWTSAKEGMPLYIGDYVRTGKNSYAVIQVEGDRLRIDEDTLIKIEKRSNKTKEGPKIELVILSGDISIEKNTNVTPAIAVKRFNNGKLITDEISKFLIQNSNWVGFEDGSKEYHRKKVELLYPCDNEVVTIPYPIFRWRGHIDGLLRIYKDEMEYMVVQINGEENKKVELKDGKYVWGLFEGNKEISSRCSFEIASKHGHLSPIRTGMRPNRDLSATITGKAEEIITLPKRENDKKVDMVHERLRHIQKVIDTSIEHIRETRKSINPDKIKNYAELYNKLDELGNILGELKVLHDSLLLEVMRLNDPKVIVQYLNELTDIEKNLNGIDKEIKEIERIVLNEGLEHPR
ncbi:MAG: hypothetical protein N2746_03770 [Deltaproteobacteria bacterium]|nr:hypothetical protein [Deltaproteobacteria bacterium]